MATASTEIRVTPEIAAEHGVTREEYARIQQILGRDPNITELGIFSVMWSEHCSYKSSKVHLKRLPTRGKLVVQGPGENAGVVDIGDGLVAAFKIESHNHPSYVEPFQGATTGVGGILRDIFTMGARPIAVLDSLRFGEITPSKNTIAEDAARNRRILDGVVRGIGSYGNCFGVPTIGGEVAFEPCYSQNPLVNALALGIAKKEEIFLAKAKGIGNPVIYVGAKTGRDGIHGASLLASAEFTEESKQKRPNVQVGDPFMEKLLLEACLEAMQTGAVVAIQDMGAAGLTCSTMEMASRGGTGIEIDLAKVPQRETGMTPYEIMLSESQERMLLVAENGLEHEVLAVFKKWGLDAVVVGQVTEGGIARINNNGRVAAEIPAHPLAEEGPVYHRPIAAPSPRIQTEKDWFAFAPEGANLTANLGKLLASPAIASKRWITEQYDTSVRTNTLAGPGASDAAVVRIKDPKTGVVKRALALSTDGNGRWCQLNPRVGAMHAVAEAARNVACSGAHPIAATNCLNFGSPEKPEAMWQFSETIDGLAEACTALGTPITGGNVSFYNETLGKSIYPTPVIGVLGILNDASRVLKIAFRDEGDLILLLDGAGDPTPARRSERSEESLFAREFSSSEYSKAIAGIVAGEPPAIDLAAEKRLQDCLVALATEGAVESAHDISDGGLAVTLAESCFASAGAGLASSALGAIVSLEDAAPAESVLFGENGARAVVSVSPAKLARVLESARQYNVAARELGKVTREGSFRIEHKGSTVIDSPLEILRDVWVHSLERALTAK
ncbi:MAG: phosphoribosylformylglycinamidine synthase II [Acidobacteria bacterium 13_2_20CM_2_57_6]|nr:MAG: phosphoribosylformylglycinamidine synthase II [Acidobacteria bacterium 13_2_20CM_2_57_6]PYT44225.1 MAG: phosphoribosylformylglycinamidine synthase subunit PurL [Acidobacteriota bacterium]PYT46471.1 MAG: phosphoribosylformylglycinamidine synthase subunit PurL [Acidobacteriota bacterium]